MIPHFWLQQDGLHRCGKRDQQHQNPQHKTDTNTQLSNPLLLQSLHADLTRQAQQKRPLSHNISYKTMNIIKEVKDIKQTRSSLISSWRSWEARNPWIGSHIFFIGFSVLWSKVVVFMMINERWRREVRERKGKEEEIARERAEKHFTKLTCTCFSLSLLKVLFANMGLDDLLDCRNGPLFLYRSIGERGSNTLKKIYIQIRLSISFR